MTLVATRLLADQVWSILDAIAGLNSYDGEIVDDNDNPTTPPLDTDGRVHPYAVFYPSPGRRDLRRLAHVPTNVAWSFQVTCVGGDNTRCLWASDQVSGALTGLRLTVDGQATGKLAEGADTGPMRRDDDVTPARLFVPLLFALYV